MALINPHINFNGNAEEAFTFYRLVVKISFELQTVWIRFIGTHREYDKMDPLKF